MPTFDVWLGASLPRDLFPDDFLNSDWNPTQADRDAAWLFYTDMRTRISTQPLQYRSGDEATALKSIYELFGFLREAIRKHGPGCRNFAILSTSVINGVVRPFTAKWHRRSELGELSREDVCHEFRAELIHLQHRLVPFQTLLGRLAEGDDTFIAGTETAWNISRQQQSASRERQESAALQATSWWPAAAADRKQRILQQSGGRPGYLDAPIAFHMDLSDAIPAAEHWEMQQAEAEEIRKRRGVNEQSELTNLVGLALSGGGIRSATFSLGVLQRLARTGMLGEVDYLSTVSGGGYVGSFLTSYLNSPPADEQEPRPDIALEPDRLPFGGRDTNESPALRWIRNHSKYLVFGDALRRVQILGLSIYGVVINLFVLLPLIVALVFSAKWTLGRELVLISNRSAWPDFPTPGWPERLFWGVLTAEIVLALLLCPVQIWCHRGGRIRRRMKSVVEWLAIRGLIAVALVCMFNALPQLAWGFHSYLVRLPDWLSKNDVGLTADQITALGTILVPIFAAIGTFLLRNQKWLGGLMRLVFLVSGPLFFVLVYCLLVEWYIVDYRATTSWFGWTKSLWMQLMLGVPLAYGLFMLNVNQSAPHRFYRNRLSEAFLIREKPCRGIDSDGKPVSSGVDHVDVQLLSRLREAGNASAPYHLINAALNVPASHEPELRGRNADFFLFSQRYCGSSLTGYSKTDELEKLDWHLDLATAMAVSAAAASPHMGIGTQRSLTFLLTLLNVRLGYWLPNPLRMGVWSRFVRFFFTTNATYLMRELCGSFTRKGLRVNLSDGGHIENLGVYELLRRRCKFIIAVDGEHDPELVFVSLMRLINYASIDLNAEIVFPHLEDFRRNADGWSPSHFTLGVIRYQPRPGQEAPDIGFIVYFKSALTGNEPSAVLDYHRRHDDFPHQTTADQFFEEDQFEAYRALGFHSADEALRDEILEGVSPSTLTVRNWIEKLVKNLMPD